MGGTKEIFGISIKLGTFYQEENNSHCKLFYSLMELNIETNGWNMFKNFQKICHFLIWANFINSKPTASIYCTVLSNAAAGSPLICGQTE